MTTQQELDMMPLEMVLDYVLEDDTTPFGGLSHINEDVEDFALDAGLPFSMPIGRLNEALMGCGIKPVTVDGIRARYGDDAI